VSCFGGYNSAMDLIHFLFYLVVSAVCAGIAMRVVPPVPGRGNNPGGFLSTAIVGIIGAWLGNYILGPIGPTLEGVPLVPAVIGSLVFVFALSMVSRVVSFKLPVGGANSSKKSK
jgi:uncharacterized membrane protein YeaQ/YmgE (transglycosylase-associated protein family)